MGPLPWFDRGKIVPPLSSRSLARDVPYTTRGSLLLTTVDPVSTDETLVPVQRNGEPRTKK